MAMTAEQLVYVVETRLSVAKISFSSTETNTKFIYLGRQQDRHYFQLRVRPVDLNMKQNQIAINQTVSVVNEAGFEDLHWRHDDGINHEEYLYYCQMSNDELVKH